MDLRFWIERSYDATTLIGVWLLIMTLYFAITRKKVVWLHLTVLVSYCLITSPHGSNWLLDRLESQYPQDKTCLTGTKPQYFILFSGGLYGPPKHKQDLTAINLATHRRLEATIELINLRGNPDDTLLISGGGRHEIKEATLLAHYLRRGLTQPIKLTMEDQSKNTLQAAEHIATLLGKSDQPYCVITSALHMPRTMLALQQKLPSLKAYPVDFRHISGPFSLAGFIPQVTSTSKGFHVLHEYLGLLWYRNNLSSS